MTDKQGQAELTTVDRLAAFIYLLARDHVLFGQVESTVSCVLQLHHKIVFSSEHIGKWAREVAARLMVEPEDGETIGHTSCPCCGNNLEIMHGEEPGKISVLSSCDVSKEDSDV